MTKKSQTTNQSLKKRNPDHSSEIKNLHRVKGQIEGIERMISEGRYCPDIMTQLRAAGAGLKSIEAEIFKTHIRSCLKQAFTRRDPRSSEEKLQEMFKLLF